MPTTFNADQFLQAAYSETTDTHRIAIPEGEWRAQIAKLAPRFNVGKDKDRTVLDVIWEIIDDEVKQKTGAEHPQVRQSLFLDLLPGGVMDFGKGKNVQLGKLREALGQNKPGKPWAPNHMMGQIAVIRTSQRPDDDDPEEVYSDVKGVAAA